MSEVKKLPFREFFGAGEGKARGGCPSSSLHSDRLTLFGVHLSFACVNEPSARVLIPLTDIQNKKAEKRPFNFGAGEGNRTLVISLEGFCSTIELHPPKSEDRLIPLATSVSLPQQRSLGGGRWIRTIVGVSQQIYSLPPLATRASLRSENRIMVSF